MFSGVIQQSIICKEPNGTFRKKHRIVQILKITLGMDCIAGLTEVKRQFLSGL